VFVLLVGPANHTDQLLVSPNALVVLPYASYLLAQRLWAAVSQPCLGPPQGRLDFRPFLLLPESVYLPQLVPDRRGRFRISQRLLGALACSLALFQESVLAEQGSPGDDSQQQRSGQRPGQPPLSIAQRGLGRRRRRVPGAKLTRLRRRGTGARLGRLR